MQRVNQLHNSTNVITVVWIFTKFGNTSKCFLKKHKVYWEYTQVYSNAQKCVRIHKKCIHLLGCLLESFLEGHKISQKWDDLPRICNNKIHVLIILKLFWGLRPHIFAPFPPQSQCLPGTTHLSIPDFFHFTWVKTSLGPPFLTGSICWKCQEHPQLL